MGLVKSHGKVDAVVVRVEVILELGQGNEGGSDEMASTQSIS